MATYFARKAGNINASDVWATTPSGTAAAVTFASGDVLVANSFAIAINVDTNLGGAGQVRNDTLGGATANGTFTLAAGVTLTANVLQNNTTGGATVVMFSANVPSQAFIVGNVTSPVNTSGGSTPINISGSGTLNFTGNATGDLHTSSFGGAISVALNGTLNFTGNATGGGGINGYAIQNFSNGTVNVTGNCYGATAPAVGNISTGIVTINGQAIGSTTTGGGAGVANLSTGVVTVKRAIGGSFGPGSTGVTAAPGVSNATLGVVSVEEIEFGPAGMSPTSGAGIRLKKANTNVAVFNYCDTAGAKTLIDATQNAAMPAATNVRSGVSYASGALTGTCAVPAAGSVALGVPVDATIGTAVLTPEAVWGAATRTLTTSSGPTAVEIRQELDSNSTKLANLDATVSSRLAPSGTLATVTTLTNAPTVPTASAIASQVRTELATELARIDAAVTTRLATSGYTAPTSAPSVADIRTELAVELGRLDASVSSRLAGSAYTAPTTPPTAAQIATAVEGSLLNEADGQAVLNAIVGAIGNTNLSEVSLVAAVRADLERNGGKLDNIPTTSAPSASSVAGAVRTELATELGRLDASVSSRLAPSGTLATVTNLTNAPASVTPSDIWSHASRTLTSASGPTAVEIRQEIDANSTKLDAAVSTRLAGSAYTAPANSDIAAIKSKTDNLPASPAATGDIPSANITAIKAKTDLLNPDRLANVATTNIVGTLLAQANS